MKTKIQYLAFIRLMLIVLVLLLGCGRDRQSKSGIINFTFEENVVGTVNIDYSLLLINITVTTGTNKENLTPIIKVADGYSLQPESGIAQDFSEPVIFTVKCDKTVLSRDWTVIVIEESAYFVAVNGNDSWSGRFSKPNELETDGPFRTIQQAASIVVPGDTVYIREGTYREILQPKNSGTYQEPIVFINYANEKVIITGTEEISSNWSVFKGNIYKTSVFQDFKQLFVNGQMMNEARWPNAEIDKLLFAPRATAKEGTDYEQLVDNNLPPGDWEGARVYIWPGSQWIKGKRKVETYQPGNKLTFDEPFPAQDGDDFHDFDPFRPRAGNPYYLAGTLAALDTAGEWYLDREEQKLYLWTPDGSSPVNNLVEYRQRDYGLNLNNLSHVIIKGVTVLGAAVNMVNAYNCLIDNVHVRYHEYYLCQPGDRYKMYDIPNRITGSNNEWRNSSVAYSALSGLVVGGTNNVIINCIIHDVNYGGQEGAAILIEQNSTGVKIKRNTLYNAGRALIRHHGAREFSIKYNHMYNGVLNTHDNGATYAWGSDGHGAVIAYNWIHDINGEGVYLDNFCENFVVHNNVIWNNSGSGIRLNSDSLNNMVFNNTIIDNLRAFGNFTYHNYEPNQKGTKVFNNIVTGEMNFVSGEKAPLVKNNAPPNLDDYFVPVMGSGLINGGIIINGFPENYHGKAPDIGAYEYSDSYWVPGADWSL